MVCLKLKRNEELNKMYFNLFEQQYAGVLSFLPYVAHKIHCHGDLSMKYEEPLAVCSSLQVLHT